MEARLKYGGAIPSKFYLNSYLLLACYFLFLYFLLRVIHVRETQTSFVLLFLDMENFLVVEFCMIKVLVVVLLISEGRKGIRKER